MRELKKKYILAKEKEDWDTICDIVYDLNDRELSRESKDALYKILKYKFGEYGIYDGYGRDCEFIIENELCRDFFHGNVVASKDLEDELWEQSYYVKGNPKYVMHKFYEYAEERYEVDEDRYDELEGIPATVFYNLDANDMKDVIETLDDIFLI